MTPNSNTGQIWTELSLRVRPDAAEAVAELLQDFTGAGVAIEPPILALGPDEGYVLDAGAPLVLHAYMYGAVAPSQRARLRRRLRATGLDSALAGPIAWRTLLEEDWAEAWKAHYDIERVGRVVVRPAWREYTPEAGEVVVDLDPGMAFGTGQHATTRMCLQLLQELLQPGDQVLDIGTGSGILAVAAVKLGAGSCLALDIEEQAVKAALENASRNGVADRVRVAQGSIDLAAAAGPFDLVLANINAATVSALAVRLRGVLNLGRELVAGGIIRERLPDCREACEAGGLVIDRVVKDGEWRTLVARRR